MEDTELKCLQMVSFGKDLENETLVANYISFIQDIETVSSTPRYNFLIDPTTPHNDLIIAESSARKPGLGWVTCHVTESIQEGIHEWCIVIENQGETLDGSGLMLGIVPAHFSRYDSFISQGGGWCLSRVGKFYGHWRRQDSNTNTQNLSFGTGDKVIFTLDMENSRMKVQVGDNYVIGEISNLSSSVYPAASLHYRHQYIAFEYHKICNSDNTKKNWIDRNVFSSSSFFLPLTSSQLNYIPLDFHIFFVNALLCNSSKNRNKLLPNSKGSTVMPNLIHGAIAQNSLASGFPQNSPSIIKDESTEFRSEILHGWHTFEKNFISRLSIFYLAFSTIRKVYLGYLPKNNLLFQNITPEQLRRYDMEACAQLTTASMSSVGVCNNIFSFSSDCGAILLIQMLSKGSVSQDTLIEYLKTISKYAQSIPLFSLSEKTCRSSLVLSPMVLQLAMEELSHQLDLVSSKTSTSTSLEKESHKRNVLQVSILEAMISIAIQRGLISDMLRALRYILSFSPQSKENELLFSSGFGEWFKSVLENTHPLYLFPMDLQNLLDSWLASCDPLAHHFLPLLLPYPKKLTSETNGSQQWKDLDKNNVYSSPFSQDLLDGSTDTSTEELILSMAIDGFYILVHTTKKLSRWGSGYGASNAGLLNSITEPVELLVDCKYSSIAILSCGFSILNTDKMIEANLSFLIFDQRLQLIKIYHTSDVLWWPKEFSTIKIAAGKMEEETDINDQELCAELSDPDFISNTDGILWILYENDSDRESSCNLSNMSAQLFSDTQENRKNSIKVLAVSVRGFPNISPIAEFPLVYRRPPRTSTYCLAISPTTLIEFGSPEFALRTPHGYITIEFWIKLLMKDENLIIYQHGDKATSGEIFIGYTRKNGIVCIEGGYRHETRGLSLVSSPISSSLESQFVHIALSFDRKWHLFINGIETSSHQEKEFHMGLEFPKKYWSMGPGCTAHIAELRIWNVSRVSLDIKRDCHRPLKGNESGLIAYFPFNESYGNTCYNYALYHSMKLPSNVNFSPERDASSCKCYSNTQPIPTGMVCGYFSRHDITDHPLAQSFFSCASELSPINSYFFDNTVKLSKSFASSHAPESLGGKHHDPISHMDLIGRDPFPSLLTSLVFCVKRFLVMYGPTPTYRGTLLSKKFIQQQWQCLSSVNSPDTAIPLATQPEVNQMFGRIGESSSSPLSSPEMPVAHGSQSSKQEDIMPWWAMVWFDACSGISIPSAHYLFSPISKKNLFWLTSDCNGWVWAWHHGQKYLGPLGCVGHGKVWPLNFMNSEESSPHLGGVLYIRQEIENVCKQQRPNSQSLSSSNVEVGRRPVPTTGVIWNTECVAMSLLQMLSNLSLDYTDPVLFSPLKDDVSAQCVEELLWLIRDNFRFFRSSYARPSSSFRDLRSPAVLLVVCQILYRLLRTIRIYNIDPQAMDLAVMRTAPKLNSTSKTDGANSSRMPMSFSARLIIAKIRRIVFPSKRQSGSFSSSTYDVEDGKAENTLGDHVFGTLCSMLDEKEWEKLSPPATRIVMSRIIEDGITIWFPSIHIRLVLLQSLLRDQLRLASNGGLSFNSQKTILVGILRSIKNIPELISYFGDGLVSATTNDDSSIQQESISSNNQIFSLSSVDEPSLLGILSLLLQFNTQSITSLLSLSSKKQDAQSLAYITTVSLEATGSLQTCLLSRIAHCDPSSPRLQFSLFREDIPDSADSALVTSVKVYLEELFSCCIQLLNYIISHIDTLSYEVTEIILRRSILRSLLFSAIAAIPLYISYELIGWFFEQLDKLLQYIVSLGKIIYNDKPSLKFSLSFPKGTTLQSAILRVSNSSLISKHEPSAELFSLNSNTPTFELLFHILLSTFSWICSYASIPQNSFNLCNRTGDFITEEKRRFSSDTDISFIMNQNHNLSVDPMLTSSFFAGTDDHMMNRILSRDHVFPYFNNLDATSLKPSDNQNQNNRISQICNNILLSCGKWSATTTSEGIIPDWKSVSWKASKRIEISHELFHHPELWVSFIPSNNDQINRLGGDVVNTIIHKITIVSLHLSGEPLETLSKEKIYHTAALAESYCRRFKPDVIELRNKMIDTSGEFCPDSIFERLKVLLQLCSIATSLRVSQTALLWAISTIGNQRILSEKTNEGELKSRKGQMLWTYLRKTWKLYRIGYRAVYNTIKGVRLRDSAELVKYIALAENISPSLLSSYFDSQDKSIDITLTGLDYLKNRIMRDFGSLAGYNGVSMLIRHTQMSKKELYENYIGCAEAKLCRLNYLVWGICENFVFQENRHPLDSQTTSCSPLYCISQFKNNTLEYSRISPSFTTLPDIFNRRWSEIDFFFLYRIQILPIFFDKLCSIFSFPDSRIDLRPEGNSEKTHRDLWQKWFKESIKHACGIPSNASESEVNTSLNSSNISLGKNAGKFMESLGMVNPTEFEECVCKGWLSLRSMVYESAKLLSPFSPSINQNILSTLGSCLFLSTFFSRVEFELQKAHEFLSQNLTNESKIAQEGCVRIGEYIRLISSLLCIVVRVLKENHAFPFFFGDMLRATTLRDPGASKRICPFSKISVQLCKIVFLISMDHYSLLPIVDVCLQTTGLLLSLTQPSIANSCFSDDPMMVHILDSREFIFSQVRIRNLPDMMVLAFFFIFSLQTSVHGDVSFSGRGCPGVSLRIAHELMVLPNWSPELLKIQPSLDFAINNLIHSESEEKQFISGLQILIIAFILGGLRGEAPYIGAKMIRTPPSSPPAYQESCIVVDISSTENTASVIPLFTDKNTVASLNEVRDVPLDSLRSTTALEDAKSYMKPSEGTEKVPNAKYKSPNQGCPRKSLLPHQDLPSPEIMWVLLKNSLEALISQWRLVAVTALGSVALSAMLGVVEHFTRSYPHYIFKMLHSNFFRVLIEIISPCSVINPLPPMYLEHVSHIMLNSVLRPLPRSKGQITKYKLNESSIKRTLSSNDPKPSNGINMIDMQSPIIMGKFHIDFPILQPSVISALNGHVNDMHKKGNDAILFSEDLPLPRVISVERDTGDSNLNKESSHRDNIANYAGIPESSETTTGIVGIGSEETGENENFPVDNRVVHNNEIKNAPEMKTVWFISQLSEGGFTDDISDCPSKESMTKDALSPTHYALYFSSPEGTIDFHPCATHLHSKDTSTLPQWKDGYSIEMTLFIPNHPEIPLGLPIFVSSSWDRCDPVYHRLLTLYTTNKEALLIIEYIGSRLRCVVGYDFLADHKTSVRLEEQNADVGSDPPIAADLSDIKVEEKGEFYIVPKKIIEVPLLIRCSEQWIHLMFVITSRELIILRNGDLWETISLPRENEWLWNDSIITHAVCGGFHMNEVMKYETARRSHVGCGNYSVGISESPSLPVFMGGFRLWGGPLSTETCQSLGKAYKNEGILSLGSTIEIPHFNFHFLEGTGSRLFSDNKELVGVFKNEKVHWTPRPGSMRCLFDVDERCGAWAGVADGEVDESQYFSLPRARLRNFFNCMSRSNLMLLSSEYHLSLCVHYAHAILLSSIFNFEDISNFCEDNTIEKSEDSVLKKTDTTSLPKKEISLSVRNDNLYHDKVEPPQECSNSDGMLVNDITDNLKNRWSREMSSILGFFLGSKDNLIANLASVLRYSNYSDIASSHQEIVLRFLNHCLWYMSKVKSASEFNSIMESIIDNIISLLERQFEYFRMEISPCLAQKNELLPFPFTVLNGGSATLSFNIRKKMNNILISTDPNGKFLLLKIPDSRGLWPDSNFSAKRWIYAKPWYLINLGSDPFSLRVSSMYPYFASRSLMTIIQFVLSYHFKSHSPRENDLNLLGGAIFNQRLVSVCFELIRTHSGTYRKILIQGLTALLIGWQKVPRWGVSDHLPLRFLLFDVNRFIMNIQRQSDNLMRGSISSHSPNILCPPLEGSSNRPFDITLFLHTGLQAHRLLVQLLMELLISGIRLESEWHGTSFLVQAKRSWEQLYRLWIIATDSTALKPPNTFDVSISSLEKMMPPPKPPANENITSNQSFPNISPCRTIRSSEDLMIADSISIGSPSASNQKNPSPLSGTAPIISPTVTQHTRSESTESSVSTPEYSSATNPPEVYPVALNGSLLTDKGRCCPNNSNPQTSRILARRRASGAWFICSDRLQRMARSNIGFVRGLFYFEVRILHNNSHVSVGVVSNPNLNPDLTAVSLGAFQHSWGFDGTRLCRFHVRERVDFKCRVKWKSGDVIGVLLNLKQGTLACFHNNCLTCSPHTNLTGKEIKYPITYYPAVGFQSGGCDINFGAAPFVMPLPNGYLPVDLQQYIISPLRIISLCLAAIETSEAFLHASEQLLPLRFSAEKTDVLPAVSEGGHSSHTPGSREGATIALPILWPLHLYKASHTLPWSSDSREGPPFVELFSSDPSHCIDGNFIGPPERFAVVRGSVIVTCDLWYFEVHVIQDCLLSIGWVTRNWTSGSALRLKSLGEDSQSWILEGSQMFVRHNGQQRTLGCPPLKDGDIVGCGLDANVGGIWFTINGIPLRNPSQPSDPTKEKQECLGKDDETSFLFTNIPARNLGLVPAIGIESRQVAACCFSAKELMYLPEGYNALGIQMPFESAIRTYITGGDDIPLPSACKKSIREEKINDSKLSVNSFIYLYDCMEECKPSENLLLRSNESEKSLSRCAQDEPKAIEINHLTASNQEKLILLPSWIESFIQVISQYIELSTVNDTFLSSSEVLRKNQKAIHHSMTVLKETCSENLFESTLRILAIFCDHLSILLSSIFKYIPWIKFSQGELRYEDDVFCRSSQGSQEKNLIYDEFFANQFCDNQYGLMLPRAFNPLSNLVGSLAVTLDVLKKYVVPIFAVKFMRSYFSTSKHIPDNLKLRLNRRLALTIRNDNTKSHNNMMYLSSSVFGQLFRLVGSKSSSLFKSNKKLWGVNFVGEGAEDIGGPFRESLSEACGELMSTDLPLFVPSPNQQHHIGFSQDHFVAPRIVRYPILFEMYHFIGRLIGGCLRSNEPLALYLPSRFWKVLVGAPLDSSDFRQFDSAFYQSLLYLAQAKKNSLSDEDLQVVCFNGFVTTDSYGEEVSLVPNGANIPVTQKNLSLFIGLCIHYRLFEEGKPVYNALRDGFFQVVPPISVHLLKWYELESLVCGHLDYDPRRLIEHARFENISFTDRRVQMLVQVLEEFSRQERALFLRFVSGRERLPTSGLRIKIMPSENLSSSPVGEPENTLSNLETSSSSAEEHPTEDAVSKNYCKTNFFEDTRFPHASTCFYWLSLPNYSSIEVMRTKLRYAIYQCLDIDADFRIHDEEMNGTPVLHVTQPEEESDYEDYFHLL